jgi:hypothetical protein
MPINLHKPPYQFSVYIGTRCNERSRTVAELAKYGFIDLYRYMVFEVPGSRLRGDFDFDGELKRGDRIACGGKVYVIRGKTYEMPPFINGLRIEIERKEDEEVEAVLSGQAKELMRLELSSARPPRIFKSSQSACKQISNRHTGVQTDPRYQASEPTK